VRLLAPSRAVLRDSTGRALKRAERVLGRRRRVAALRRPAADAGQRHAPLLQRHWLRRRSIGQLLDVGHRSGHQAPQLQQQHALSQRLALNVRLGGKLMLRLRLRLRLRQAQAPGYDLGPPALTQHQLCAAQTEGQHIRNDQSDCRSRRLCVKF